MSHTFNWCQDRTKLSIYGNQVFYVSPLGIKYWHLNDKLHRENWPAIENPDGRRVWYSNGKRHRVDGHAIEYANGNKWWFLNGKQYSESAYWKELKK